jgi:hypothetical protein
MNEVHAKMEGDGTSTLELELVLGLEDVSNLPRIPSNYGKVVDIHTNVLVCITFGAHPDVGLSLGGSEPHIT